MYISVKMVVNSKHVYEGTQKKNIYIHFVFA